MKVANKLLSPIKHFISLTISMLLIANIAQAEESEGSSLDRIYQATIHSYYSINGFYNFSANQGAQKDLNDINESIDNLQELINNLRSDAENNGAGEQFDEVSSSWKTYQKVLKQNIKEVKATGYPDLRLAGDMATSNIALNTALNDLSNTLSGIIKKKPSKATSLSRAAASNMALMMTKYSARTTSTVSQVYASGDVDKEVTIDALATEFSNQMAQLMKLAEGNANASKLLDSAQTKWDFIKNSYINYNENRVNFIVNLYSKKIISNIEQALAAR